MVYNLGMTNIIFKKIKMNNIYHESNIFNVAYQRRTRIVFLFNSKLNACAERNKRAEGISK